MATTNYGWTTPTVGGSDGTWGASLNANWTDLDTELKAVSDVADAAMPVAWGTFTGSTKLKRLFYTLDDVGTGISGTHTIDLSAGDFHTVSLVGGGNVTLNFTNVPTTGNVQFFTVEIIGSGSLTVSWDSRVEWPGGNAPIQTPGGKDVYTFYTRNGGTSFAGARVLEDIS